MQTIFTQWVKNEGVEIPPNSCYEILRYLRKVFVSISTHPAF